MTEDTMTRTFDLYWHNGGNHEGTVSTCPMCGGEAKPTAAIWPYVGPAGVSAEDFNPYHDDDAAKPNLAVCAACIDRNEPGLLADLRLFVNEDADPNQLVFDGYNCGDLRQALDEYRMDTIAWHAEHAEAKRHGWTVWHGNDDIRERLWRAPSGRYFHGTRLDFYDVIPAALWDKQIAGFSEVRLRDAAKWLLDEGYGSRTVPPDLQAFVADVEAIRRRQDAECTARVKLSLALHNGTKTVDEVRAGFLAEGGVTPRQADALISDTALNGSIA